MRTHQSLKPESDIKPVINMRNTDKENSYEIGKDTLQCNIKPFYLSNCYLIFRLNFDYIVLYCIKVMREFGCFAD